MRRRVEVPLLALTVTFGLSMIVLLSLYRPLRAGILCVESSGAGGCFTTVQAAVDSAVPGDTVQVVAGTYVENVIVNKDLTLLGGFDDVSFVDRTLRSSVIDGGAADTTLKVENGAFVVVEGFTIRNGDATAGGGAGGGISVVESNAVIRDNLIVDNVANRDPAQRGRGGGIYVISSTLPISIAGNTIHHNLAHDVAASTAPNGGSGDGGGVYLNQFDRAEIVGNDVAGNLAAQASSVMTDVSGFGGGIFALFGGDLQLQDNRIEQNQALNHGIFGYGGGVLSYGVPYVSAERNRVAENTAAQTSSEAQGGGFWLAMADDSDPFYLVSQNQVLSNTAAVTLTSSTVVPAPFAAGGGLHIAGNDVAGAVVNLYDNVVRQNVAAAYVAVSNDAMTHQEGGGLSLVGVDIANIEDNEFAANVAVEELAVAGSGSGAWAGRPAGGGVYLSNGQYALVTNNVISQNLTVGIHRVTDVNAGSSGGGIEIADIETLDFADNLVISNTTVLTGDVSGSVAADYFAHGGGLNISCHNAATCRFSMTGGSVVNNKGASLLQPDGPNVGVRATGGGLAAAHVPQLSIANAAFSLNTALGHVSATQPTNIYACGGALNVFSEPAQNSFLTLNASEVMTNTAAASVTIGTGSVAHEEGGGLCAVDLVSVDVSASQFRGNVAVDQLTVSGDDSNSWTGRPSGGGIYIGNSMDVSVGGNEIAGNTTTVSHIVNQAETTTEGGGIALINVGLAVVEENSIRDNQAAGQASLTSDSGIHYNAFGGGIFIGCWDEATCSTQIYANHVVSNAGGAQITAAGGNATAAGSAGGIYVHGGDVFADRNRIENNHGTRTTGNGFAGAIHFDVTDVTMRRNLIGENQSNPLGQNTVVHLYESTLVSENDIFVGNSSGLSSDSHGVARYGTLTNATFFDNGELAIEAGQNINLTVYNTIIAGHNQGLLTTGNGVMTSDYNLLFDNGSHFTGAVTQLGNDLIDLDPLFVDPLALDVHLQASSPAIDAADDAVAPGDDHEGVLRPVDGDLDGVVAADVGAYEFVPRARGDCNGDGKVDAGDIAACILEIFDDDGDEAPDASAGSFAGDPIGCDSNADGFINAGDIACNILLIFDGPGACATPSGSAAARPAKLALAEQAVDAVGATVRIPLTLESNGQAIAAAAFAVNYDPSRLQVSVDDVAFTLPAEVATSVTLEPGEIQIVMGDFTAPLTTLADGELATLAFRVLEAADGTIMPLNLITTSMGNTSGQSIPVVTVAGSIRVGDASDAQRVYLPTIQR